MEVISFSCILFIIRYILSPHTATVTFFIKLPEYIDLGKFSLAVFRDLSYRFYCVDHNLVLTIPKNYGIRGVASNCFHAFQTKIYKIKSNCMSIDIGVPQGSISIIYFVYFIHQFVSSFLS